MRVTSEMLARYERECEKRDAEKQMEAGVHMATTPGAPTKPAPSVAQTTSTTAAPDDAATVDNEKHAGENEDAMDDGILEELTIPGIVINIGEINFGEANINIHSAEHYESSVWQRDGSRGDDSADGGYYDSDEGDASEDGETGDGGDVGTTSAILSTEHHSVEVDQADMKDAISHILKVDRRTVEKVFLGMRLYLDALAEVMDEMGEPGESGESADDPDAREAQSASSKADTSRGVHTEGQCAGCGHRVSDVHSVDIPGIGCKITFSVHSVPDTDSVPDSDSAPDGDSVPGCRMVRSTPESRAAAHLV